MPLPPIRMLLPLLFCGICGACSDLGETLGLKENLREFVLAFHHVSGGIQTPWVHHLLGYLGPRISDADY